MSTKDSDASGTASSQGNRAELSSNDAGPTFDQFIAARNEGLSRYLDEYNEANIRRFHNYQKRHGKEEGTP